MFSSSDGTPIQTLQRQSDPDTGPDPTSPQNLFRDRINAVTYSSDGQWLVVAGLDEMIHLWQRNLGGTFNPQPS
jgi:WD40 repeat protein